MAWKITRDLIGDKGYKATHTAGPSNATPETLARLDAGEGEKFRMLDDDSIVYYHGLYIEDDSEIEGGIWEPSNDQFQPLDNFGRPNDGCTMIEYKNAAGAWELL